MATLPNVDVVFVGYGMVGGVISSELSKRASSLKMVALERGPFRNTNPDFLMDHFDEFRYAVQGQLFQDVARETWTFRNDTSQSALPVRELGAFLPGNGVGGAAVHWNGMSWRFLDYFFRVPHAPRAALRKRISARKFDDPGLGSDVRGVGTLLHTVGKDDGDRR